MHNVDTQALHNPANRVRTPHLDLMRMRSHLDMSVCTYHTSRRDLVCDHARLYSRDRNRRT